MAIVCKSAVEIAKMRRSGHIVREVLDYLRPLVGPGVSTMDIERAAEQKIRDLGAKPAFKGYFDYPCVLCTSINDEVVHGIPSEKRVLKEGDIVSIDCGVIIDGFYSDAAVTHPVGKVSPATTKLLETTLASLEAAILQCQPGGRLVDISSAVQQMCEAQGFGVVREFVGHGIGRSMHEDPQVP